MGPAALISSTPGCPIISLKSMTGTRDGGGIGPNFAIANSDILRVPVLAFICRCSGGVVVKNGNANRDGGDLPGRVWGRFGLLGMQSSQNFLQLVRLPRRSASIKDGQTSRLISTSAAMSKKPVKLRSRGFAHHGVL